jgi:hypothetical protein
MKPGIQELIAVCIGGPLQHFNSDGVTGSAHIGGNRGKSADQRWCLRQQNRSGD